jgi:hypothetical protein
MTRQDDTAHDEALARALSRLPEPEVPEGLAARIVARATAKAQPEPVADRPETIIATPPAPMPTPRILPQSVPAAAQPEIRSYGRWAVLAASVAAVVLVAGGLAFRTDGPRTASAPPQMVTNAPPKTPAEQAAPATPATAPAGAHSGQLADRSDPVPTAPADRTSRSAPQGSLADIEPLSPDATRLAGPGAPGVVPPAIESGTASGPGKTLSAQAGPPAPGPDAVPRARGVYGPPAPSAFSITGGTGGAGAAGAPVGRSSGGSEVSPGSAPQGGARPGGPPRTPGGGFRP